MVQPVVVGVDGDEHLPDGDEGPSYRTPSRDGTVAIDVDAPGSAPGTSSTDAARTP